MSYAALNSPLPGLTVSPDGCHACGMRGLGDAPVDYGSLPIDTNSSVDSSVYAMPVDTYSYDYSTLPLTISPSSDLSSFYPQSIGTEFVGNGDGTYTNIQTGQSVPYSVAQQITAATTGAASSSVDTQSAAITGTIIDPATGANVSLNNLTAAAQALNAAGNLVTKAGQLTAQGSALLAAGSLYQPGTAPVSTTPNLSSALTSLSSFFTESSVIAGVPNWILMAGIVIGGPMLFGSFHIGRQSEYYETKPRKRRR